MNLAETIDHLNGIAPLEYAASWDNVGLLIDPSLEKKVKRILLTIDTTPSVLEEAIKKKVDLIISYHPILFHPIQSLSMRSPQQAIAIELIRHKIALYSPHTALDHVTGGVNDWLADQLGAGEVSHLHSLDEHVAGEGRKIVLQRSVTLHTLCEHLKKAFNLSYLRVAKGSKNGSKQLPAVQVQAHLSCEMFKPIATFTGEMSHHEVLAAQRNDTHVILSEHTHTEEAISLSTERSFKNNWVQLYILIFLSGIKILTAHIKSGVS